MARVTKAMLEHQNAMLRGEARQMRTDLTFEQERSSLYAKQLALLEKHISVMTIASERIADALAHTIGYMTDGSRIVEGRHKDQEKR